MNNVQARELDWSTRKLLFYKQPIFCLAPSAALNPSKLWLLVA